MVVDDGETPSIELFEEFIGKNFNPYSIGLPCDIIREQDFLEVIGKTALDEFCRKLFLVND